MRGKPVIQPALLTDDPRAGATFSADRRYRYTLWRTWDPSRPVINWLMLNPSTADEQVLDPTITRCVGFTKAWGGGGLTVTNLFAYRATNPLELKKLTQTDAVSHPDDFRGYERNDLAIMGAAQEARRSGGKTICGWGAHGKLLGRGTTIPGWLTINGIPLYCLAVNADGSPKHPLYIRGDAQPIVYPRAMIGRPSSE